MEPNTLTLPASLELKLHLTDEQFWQLCQDNQDLQFERTKTGELIIMPPTGGSTGKRNFNLAGQLYMWNSRTNLGEAFDSSTGFKLPNGADRSPDASWVSQERWDALTSEQQEKFVPLCPDFVIELMSPSDTLEKTRAKLQEYRENGAKLGWLINRKQKQLEIYRPEQAVEILNQPSQVSGEDILPGFVLDLTAIW